VKIPLDPKRGLWIDALQVWLNLEDEVPVCRDKTGKKIPSLADSIEQEKEAIAKAADEARLKDEAIAKAADLARQNDELQVELRRLRGV
jgi:hypothetical protein